jgi:peptidoglycan/LPS O-acetylase OafA/YrhL
MDAAHRNNFDLIRLAAALQVVLVHGAEHLDLANTPLIGALTYVPGVPIFFIISGYLVSSSFRRSSDVRRYVKSRILRVYPALWVCLIVGVLVAMLVGVSFLRWQTVPWIAAQLTIVQFYNPDFLSGFGVGVLNGSLWTIPVELQFYIILPFVLKALDRVARPTIWLVVTIVVGAVVAQAYNALEGGSLLAKLAQVTLAPHLYMFLIGTLLQEHEATVKRMVGGRVLPIFVMFAAGTVVLTWLGFSTAGNRLNPASVLLLAALVMSVAYSSPALSHRVLKGNDISYGLYIYHMLVINVFVQLGWLGSHWLLWAVVVLSAVLAAASWVIIERPALRLKTPAPTQAFVLERRAAAGTRGEAVPRGLHHPVAARAREAISSRAR